MSHEGGPPMLRQSIRCLAVAVGRAFILVPAPARRVDARAAGCPTDGGREYVPPLLKILFAATLAGAMVSTVVHAACMQDRWGHVVCGAGPCVRDREGMVYCAPTRF